MPNYTMQVCDGTNKVIYKPGESYKVSEAPAVYGSLNLKIKRSKTLYTCADNVQDGLKGFGLGQVFP